jgi:hypothetical protein
LWKSGKGDFWLGLIGVRVSVLGEKILTVRMVILPASGKAFLIF